MATIPKTRVIALLVILVVGPAYGQAGVDRVDSDSDRVPLHTVVPEYPDMARRDRIEGSVKVCFNISRGGDARGIAVRRSTNRLFEKVAKKAVRQSTWQPLPKEVQLSGIKACRTFRFSLVPLLPSEEDADQS